MTKIGTIINTAGAAYIDNSITILTAQQPESTPSSTPEPEMQEMALEDYYINNPQGQLLYPNKQYHPINYIRIFNAMFELGYFVDENGVKPNKADFFNKIGSVMGLNLSHYSTNLSYSITHSNDFSEDETTKLFDSLKKKALDYVDIIKKNYKEKHNMR